MKKAYVCLLSFASLGLINGAFAADAPPVQVSSRPSASTLTQAQVVEIEKIIANYLKKNPDVIMNSFQAGMEAQQKEATAKMEKAVAENKNKIFKDAATPTAGNPHGTQSLVVFMDPYCGYCKKFHKELITLLKTNKDVKVIFKDIPIMGSNSEIAIKAMLAAKDQGKYDQLQNAIYSSDKSLTKKQILKIASSLGIDTKKLEHDMNDKTVQAEIDQNLELSKTLGINGTPTLIVGETTVLPGYVSAEELNKKLKESADNKLANGKAS
jgi:protein-disulfide isomerase